MEATYQTTVWLELKDADDNPEVHIGRGAASDIAHALQEQVPQARVVASAGAVSIHSEETAVDASTAQLQAEDHVLAALSSAGIDRHRADISEVDVAEK